MVKMVPGATGLAFIYSHQTKLVLIPILDLELRQRRFQWPQLRRTVVLGQDQELPERSARRERREIHRTVASVHIQVLQRGAGGQRGQVQREQLDVDEGQAQPPQPCAATQGPQAAQLVAGAQVQALQRTAGGQRHQVRNPHAAIEVERLERGARGEWLKAGHLQP